MLEKSTVLYDATIKGERVTVTLGDLQQSDENTLKILKHGIKRAMDSARTNATDKDQAEYDHLQKLLKGEPWKQGGGNAIDARTRMYREHLAVWAETHAGMKRSDADKLARKDSQALLQQVAIGVLQAKGEKKMDGERKVQAAENLKSRIMRDVDSALNVEADI